MASDPLNVMIRENGNYEEWRDNAGKGVTIFLSVEAKLDLATPKMRSKMR